MLLVRKPRERICDIRNISAYDGWNVPKITQSYTRLILFIVFSVYFNFDLQPWIIPNYFFNLWCHHIFWVKNLSVLSKFSTVPKFSDNTAENLTHLKLRKRNLQRLKGSSSTMKFDLQWLLLNGVIILWHLISVNWILRLKNVPQFSIKSEIEFRFPNQWFYWINELLLSFSFDRR